MEGNLDIMVAVEAIIISLVICLPIFTLMRKLILNYTILGVTLYCLITFTLATIYYMYTLDMF